MINKKIIKAYDIRGVYNESFNEKTFYEIGRHFGTKYKNVIVGMDGRHSSDILEQNLISGLIHSGANVLNIGLVPTPIVWFGINTIDSDLALMITASHNPPSDNGLKAATKNTTLIYDDFIEILNNIPKNYTTNGIIQYIDIEDIYIDRILKDFIPPTKEIKVVWNPFGGATCNVLKKIIKKLKNIKSIIINQDIDPNFASCEPDPTKEKNMKDLINVVLKEGADIGIGFDGDGDRIGVVDSMGRLIPGDILTGFFAKDILKTHKNAKIIAEIKSSKALKDLVEHIGGKFIMSRTGHSYIKRKIKEENAIFAGELSGHIFFADKYFGFDDGLYAAIRLLSLKDNLVDFFDQMKTQYVNENINIECSKHFEIIENIKNEMISNNIKFCDIDGIRVNYDFGWWLLRASNTQNLISGRIEANDTNGIIKLKNELNHYLFKYNIML